MKKRIYLFCSQGMSTSMLAHKMQEVANSNNMPVIVEAHAHGLLEEKIQEDHPDVILLGPQVKYLYKETIEKFGHCGAPIEVISSEDYGVMDGAKVLKMSLLALKNFKK